MFGVTKHIAHKSVVKSDYVLQTTVFKFYKPQLLTAPTNSKNDETTRKNNILGSKSPFNLKLRPSQ